MNTLNEPTHVEPPWFYTVCVYSTVFLENSQLTLILKMQLPYDMYCDVCGSQVFM